MITAPGIETVCIYTYISAHHICVLWTLRAVVAAKTPTEAQTQKPDRRRRRRDNMLVVEIYP